MTDPRPLDKVTSADVAQLAGVSQSAVSRVFTPGASASQKTAAKVRAAAEHLGYRPNILARAMITGRSRIIGLVVAYLENQFYPVALERLSSALQDRGYHILIFMAGNGTEHVGKVVDDLLDYQVDGIITASVAMTNDLTLRCQTAGIPVVMFNRGQNDPRLSEVTSDNRLGGRRVAEFLIAGGHRRIAHIMGWQGSSTGRDRAEGFREGLAARGLAPFAMVDGEYSRERAAEAARAICAGPERPDGIFVGNDHMAFAVIDELVHRMGLRVPEDISIVGYDDVPIAAWAAYSLTTIRQPVETMVDATVEIMLGQIEGNTESRHHRIVGPLVIRRSARIPEGYAP